MTTDDEERREPTYDCNNSSKEEKMEKQEKDEQGQHGDAVEARFKWMLDRSIAQLSPQGIPSIFR